MNNTYLSRLSIIFKGIGSLLRVQRMIYLYKLFMQHIESSDHYYYLFFSKGHYSKVVLNFIANNFLGPYIFGYLSKHYNLCIYISVFYYIFCN